MVKQPTLFYLEDTGEFPNSSLPVVFYRQALHLPTFFKARHIKALFARNRWTNSWDSGVFTYHHYNSTSHEVLGFYKGGTKLHFDGWRAGTAFYALTAASSATTKSKLMSDNKKLTGQQDRNKVNSKEPYEVEDLHQKYPHLAHQTVADAIKKHGPDRKTVEKYLVGLGKGK